MLILTECIGNGRLGAQLTTRYGFVHTPRGSFGTWDLHIGSSQRDILPRRYEVQRNTLLFISSR